jgi:hypothetical protein
LTFFKLHGFAPSGKGQAPRELSHDEEKRHEVAPRRPPLY